MRLDDLADDACPWCGAEIARDTKRSMLRIYCSRQCSMAHYHQMEKDARLEAKKHRPPCKRCGKPVPVEMDSRAVYCSHACQNKGGIDKTCAGCGRAFKGHKRGKFCSQACMGLAFRRQDRTCQHCGTAYTPTHGRQRYCGHSCAGKVGMAKRRATDGRDNRWRENGPHGRLQE